MSLPNRSSPVDTLTDTLRGNMKKRRGRDEGSIYKRKDGRWVAVYTVEGKKRYIYAKTRKEAARD